MNSSAKGKEDALRLADIQKLIEVLGSSTIDELELEMGGSRLKLSKHPPQAPSAPVVASVTPPAIHLQAPTPAQVALAPASEPPPAASPAPSAPAPQAGEGHAGKAVPAGSAEVKSPMVGTFYRSAAPGADPFVKIGDRVKKGQTLCIIEAMKLFNEIECEVDGVVADILVDNAQPVEYGECLMLIQPGA